jgi:hypothetical protein
VRVLFLLLLLANLLFLAWTRWVDAPARSTAVPANPVTAQDLQPIRLIGEPASGTGATAGSGESAGTPALLAASCVSVGPFIDPVHAGAATAQLERLGFTSRRRVALDDVRVGTWVYVSDLATPADAAVALAALQAAGLTDATIVTDEGPGNIVSVGVYADPARATETAAAVERAGFTPSSSDRRRALEVLWLDVDRQANGGLPALDALGAPPAGALPYDMRACPAAAGDADVTAPAVPEPAATTAPATG